jgi:ribosome-binding protein aMBF1 (putative translation factor)
MNRDDCNKLYSELDHQDWKTIVVKNKREEKASKPKINNEQQKLNSIEKKVENDKLKHKTITLELRKNIEKARCLKKLTQKQLANNINFPLQFISDIESGKAIYNHQHINKIKRYLKLK